MENENTKKDKKEDKKEVSKTGAMFRLIKALGVGSAKAEGFGSVLTGKKKDKNKE